jgi:hypothetical protein
VNGGFETGGGGLFSGSLFGWNATGKTMWTFVSHTGVFSAQVGNGGVAGDSTISQSFTVPHIDDTLGFWYQPSCSNPSDWASATLVDNTTNTTTALVPNTCVQNVGWVPASTFVTAGDSYTLTLTNHDVGDAKHPNVTYLDDLTLSDTGRGAALTPPTAVNVDSSGHLTWSAPVTTATPLLGGYVVSRDGTTIATLPASTTSLQDTLADGRSHTYKVSAYYDIATTSHPDYVDVSDPVRVAEPPTNVVRGSQGRVCWDPVQGFNGSNDEYSLYIAGMPQTVLIQATGHDPNTPVCWTPDPSIAGTYSWQVGSSYPVAVSAYTPNVLESYPNEILSYMYVPSVAGQTQGGFKFRGCAVCSGSG